MSSTVDTAVARALARMQAGEHPGEMLRTLREVDGLGAPQSREVLQKLAAVGDLWAGAFVAFAAEGADLSHLDLRDLRYLAEIERLRHGPLKKLLQLATVGRFPHLRCEAIASQAAITCFWSEDRKGPHFGQSCKLDDLHAEMVGDVRVHVEVVREEPGLLVLRFPRIHARTV